MLWGYRAGRGSSSSSSRTRWQSASQTDDGKVDFVTMNERVPVPDPITGQVPYLDENGQVIAAIMDDVSTWEFDIVLSDEPTSPSTRTAAFWKLLEAARQGVPIPPDVILEASDIPQKEQIKQAMANAQAQAMQAKGGRRTRPRGSGRERPADQGGHPPDDFRGQPVL